MTPPSVATPTAVASSRHFLTLDALGAEGLAALLDLTGRLKRDPELVRGALGGRRLGMYFAKPSTRTRVSFEAAAWKLGMLPVVLRPDELQLGRGETIADTARALSLYLDALTVRTFAQADVEALAEAASIPVINALTDEHHPCQGLADLLTLEEEFGTLAGVKLAFVGDGDNVCHSLIQGAALAGFDLRVATPVGYEPSLAILDAAQQLAATTGGSIELTHDPREAVFGADAVYADVWTSMGREAEREARQKAFVGYRVDAALMAEASRAAIFLHCLPAHRGEEVSADVIDGKWSRVWDEAENRLHAQKSILAWCFGAI